MVAYCHLKITETSNQLQDILNQQKTATSYRKIQALYLFKTGQIKTIKEIANALGVHRVSVQRWFKQYAEEGLTGLLTVKKQTGRPKAISSLAETELRKKLHDKNNEFKNYADIQKWLLSEYGEHINYKTLHNLVKYKLKAKLKFPRKSTVKKSNKDSRAEM
ncbi:MAG: transposase [Trichodesmium sp.]